MKVNEVCKVGFSRPVFNDVIDCRGFVKTPPYQIKQSKPKVSGQGSNNGLKVVAQPISPSIK